MQLCKMQDAGTKQLKEKCLPIAQSLTLSTAPAAFKSHPMHFPVFFAATEEAEKGRPGSQVRMYEVERLGSLPIYI